MQVFDIETTNCPYCGYKLDACTAITGEHVPKEGDITICLKCQEPLMIVDDKGSVRKPTTDESAMIAGDLRIAYVRGMLKTAAEFMPKE
jgi:hypothetical protein